MAAQQMEAIGISRADGHSLSELTCAVQCCPRLAPHNLATGTELCDADAYESFRDDSFSYAPALNCSVEQRRSGSLPACFDRAHDGTFDR
jgi:hypothetical protein